MPDLLTTRLDRVVAATFDEGFTVLEAEVRENPPRYSVRVGGAPGSSRTVCFRLDGVWLEAFVPELNVQCAILDDHDAGMDPDEGLAMLCRALRVYLRGEARIEHRPRLLRAGANTVLCIESDGHRWRLGRNRWSVK